MITNKLVHDTQYVELVGTSLDNKPTNVGANSLFTELDTGDTYYFDGTWKKIGSGVVE